MKNRSHTTTLKHPGLETASAPAIWKRRVYQLSLAAGSLILILSWYMRAPGDGFVAWVYPVFAILLLLYLVMIRYADTVLPMLEIAMFATVAALVLTRLAWHFFVFRSIDDRLLVLTGGHYWSIAILLVASVLIFNRRRGIVAGSAVLALSILIAVAGLAVAPPADGLGGETTRHLLRVHLFLVLIFVLASSGAMFREQYNRAVLRAEILAEWASLDALTGIANRRAADQQLTQTVAQAVRHERPLSIIIADIDHFKRLNDKYGHKFGDTVLQEVAARLGRLIRESDFIARWGGEEFLIIAPETCASDAAQLAERCRAGIADAPLAETQVTITFGVAELKANDSVDSLLIRADAKLYEGKASGRNAVRAD